MPSPFPGMDPFLEQQEWSDFHADFNTVMREQLAGRLEPRYFVRVERRIYMEKLASEDLPETEPRVSWKKPDVSIGFSESSPGSLEFESKGGVAVADEELEPMECLLLEPVEHQESYLVVRETGSGEIVTVIETLSPANKRAGSTGRNEYLEKREMTLNSPVHLVELDLLRGGERLPMRSLPSADYYALVSRAARRPRVVVYSWELPRRLPKIPIPLKPEDPEPKLDLQAALTTVYDRAKYQLSVDYSKKLQPPLDDDAQSWLYGIVNQQQAVSKD